MRSKIEEGCTAMVVGGKSNANTGKMVTVGSFVNTYDKIGCDGLWEVNVPMEYYNMKGDLSYHNLYPEDLMQRIDGHGEDETREVNRELEESAR